MLAMLGFEVKRGIASREEMEKPARMAQESAPARQRERAAPAQVAPAEAAKAAVKPEQPATDEQKQNILNLLESLRPGDRRAQRTLLKELTGKESRDDLTQKQASNLIYKLKREADRESI
jgi:hypothetical protein